jgi:hypothetical protein
METRAIKSKPDEEEHKLRGDLESCRAHECAMADQLSKSRRSMGSSVYTVLVEALNALRLVCNQKLFAYRAYRDKKVHRRGTDAT